jgi:hypothetical protein
MELKDLPTREARRGYLLAVVAFEGSCAHDVRDRRLLNLRQPCAWHGNVATQQKERRMALIGFKNTHNQSVYINPMQVLYVTTFEEEVTIIALALASAGGKPTAVYVRGNVDQVQQRLSVAVAG